MTNTMHKTAGRDHAILQLISYGVIANGLIIILTTLLHEFHTRGIARDNDLLITLPLISGLTLVYLGSLLHRRKRVAWAITIPLYGFILGLNLAQLAHGSMHHPSVFMRSIVLPSVVVGSLIYFNRFFNVKSDIRNFTVSLRVSFAILTIAFVYGVSGYMLMDKHDFHQEINLSQATHHTIDQFDFTTDQQLTPYTRRAHVFVDSLNILTTVALGYAIISLFQPTRARFTNQSSNRQRFTELLTKNSQDSEDFFKIWPQDKTYYFDDPAHMRSGLAFRVQNGVALVVGDPVGNEHHFRQIYEEFSNLCRTNDWLPIYTQITESNRVLYEQNDMTLQKIGEEAVLSVNHFLTNLRGQKYFRQISNKFNNRQYTSQVLKPPHSTETLARLQQVSNEWLTLPGRQERGFMMGYYSDAYLQQCDLVVARDQDGVIQGFVNQIPTFQKREANYDLLRHSKAALGNINDYLMIGLLEYVHGQGYSYFNLGLSPLTGVGHDDDEKSLIDSTLRFVYANGDRFYSFSGLHRFKSKYEPEWRERFVAYPGGIRNFSRAVYALNKAMNKIK